ncbi:hypothetical protein [Microbacterium sp. SMR1]|uniref:hypothetical protein n=1 Tax=Microbacterium sp. SMR1 TaxID=1497340 RepID=UPI000DCC6D9A|nr:hypothetical protein [Microbacterium sp. SMR1]RAZ30537.1 hypothetical protein DO944_13400 [Microbacterium sp. SMR1]
MVAVLVMMTGCTTTAPGEADSFGSWSERMLAELSTGDSGPAGGGSNTSAVGFEVGSPGWYTVAAACRGTAVVELILTSAGREVGSVDVPCGATATTEVELRDRELVMETEAIGDWYVVLTAVQP